MGTDKVLRVERDHVTVLTINRPEVRNAVDVETARTLNDHFDELEKDPSVRAVVLTGAGDKSFCAGMDVRAAASEGSDGHLKISGGFAGITRRDFPKPLIAAVNGAALGGGFEVVLACDLVVAAEHAMFGLPEVRLGRLAGGGGLLRLARLIPTPLALEMAMTAEPVVARRAYELGLVNAVVPADEVLTEAIGMAAKIARQAPLAVAGSKRVVKETADLPLKDAWRLNYEIAREVRDSNDAAEGLRAFSERRDPMWTNS
ncbi:crotonase/enoyl-CoA hydratase family protein [Amycolatopsis thermophila]|uniref:Enoyl-CoA hydratase/carnithine racemase n=1 Tax=Amycolatopsis thermophila TaxID=206084 RepID=A0ABU0F6P7_9PSEU|nr:crotonase/enoyl-CoA hydratase family protein [Amycolatopsis thermophila]MDQ0382720.1 enoyl-CoA hydratase/carnithine racemase [Amycolatopsis thermophila]